MRYRSLKQAGLKQGEAGLKIIMMCEVPSNALMADEFLDIFDGFSIGSNDLTQLTLGVDRDSELVAFDFDERDPGMLAMLKLAIDGAHRNHRKPGSIGACATPGRVFKGQRMPGRMGAVRQTTMNLTLHGVDVENNLLLIKGAVPGSKGQVVLVRSAVKGA